MQTELEGFESIDDEDIRAKATELYEVQMKRIALQAEEKRQGLELGAIMRDKGVYDKKLSIGDLIIFVERKTKEKIRVRQHPDAEKEED